MSASRCRDELTALLERHLEQIGAANGYLTDIRQAIADNDHEGLQRSLARADFDVAAIERLENERHGLLAAHDFTPDLAGFERCIAWCDADGSVAARYQQLVQALISLQHSIQLNQLLIDRGRDRVRRSLGLLSGLGGAAQCRTYGSNGKTEQPPGRRNIAIA